MFLVDFEYQTVLAFTLFVLIICFLMFNEETFSDMTYETSSVNGLKYLVRDLPDKKDACELLGVTHEKLKRVCKYLNQKYPNDPRTIKVISRFPKTVLRESYSSSSQTSYSLNKGEKIVLCLRAKDGSNELVDENLLFFVALHELSHIMTNSKGHTDEFWNNFKFVLKECQDNGMYKCIDFSSSPKKYCGITVTSSPFPCSPPLQ